MVHCVVVITLSHHETLMRQGFYLKPDDICEKKKTVTKF